MSSPSNKKRRRAATRGPAPCAALLLAAACGFVVLATGCETKTQSKRPASPYEAGTSSSQTEESRETHFDQAMGFQFALDSYEFEPAAAQVTYHLNRWIENQTPPADWRPDALVSQIPPRHRAIEPLEQLDRLLYHDDDVRYLEETIWQRDIGDWTRRSAPNEPFEDWVAAQQDAIGPGHADQLILAERLFDWVVRNIQLDPTLPYPKDEVVVPGASASASAGAQSRLLPPARGQPGPGYMLQPWEALLRGHGDSLVKARLFILLARQQGIDAVMLGLYNRANPSLPRPWLPAVLLGDDLYLFDVELGLPIPNAQGEGVATLAQVLDSPQILAALDIGENLKYRAHHEDLENLSAMIDAAPQSLALRMSILEARLVGDQQVTLTVPASNLAAALQKCRGISNVHLWTLPYETYMFHQWLAEALKTNESLQALYLGETFVFSTLTPLVKGRFQHFRGMFEDGASDGRVDAQDDMEFELEKPGAKTLYMEMRVPDSVVAKIRTSPDLQAQYGLQQQRGEPPQLWQARINNAEMMFRQAKMHASFWMGLAQYESGNYGAAIDWLKGRTLEAIPDGPWSHAARYNLARSYEKLGNLEEARKLYLADTSPQRHGNLLRAKQLGATDISDDTPPADSDFTLPPGGSER